MKKQIIVGNTTYTIEVKLNFRIEKRLNGKREHIVLITDDKTTDHQDFYITELDEIKKIENTLLDKTLTEETQEQKQLIKLGYK